MIPPPLQPLCTHKLAPHRLLLQVPSRYFALDTTRGLFSSRSGPPTWTFVWRGDGACALRSPCQLQPIACDDPAVLVSPFPATGHLGGMNNSLSPLTAMERSLKTAAQGEPDPTEEDRIRRAAAGDRRAFAWLVDHHRSLVCAISLAVVGDVAASEDIAQEVFLGVWPRLGELRNPHSFLPWLRQYTRNTARQCVRGRRRRQTRIAEGTGDDLVMAAADDRPSPCEALERAEERGFLLEAIAALPDPTREAVLLYYREGESAQQVARLLGVSEAAVKQRLHRAREFLRAAVWTRLADVLPRSTPGAAFTAAVLLALPLVAPASAATLASAGAVGAAGATAKAGVKPLGAAGAAVGYFSLGMAGAVAASSATLVSSSPSQKIRWSDEPYRFTGSSQSQPSFFSAR